MRRAVAGLGCEGRVGIIYADGVGGLLPGGFVMPCLLPVMIIDAGLGLEDEAAACMSGRKVLRPLIWPKRFVSMICSHIFISTQSPQLLHLLIVHTF